MSECGTLQKDIFGQIGFMCMFLHMPISIKNPTVTYISSQVTYVEFLILGLGFKTAICILKGSENGM
jgi:hypothetical protein